MDWRRILLVAYIISTIGLGQSTSAPAAMNLNSTSAPTAQSANSFGTASAVLLRASHTASLFEANGQKAATSSTAASSSTGLSAATLSQVAAAASSRALAGASNATYSGSQVGALAQVIIAIGVIPVELIIVAIVLGVHRLRNRKPSRPLQTRAEGQKPTGGSLPYLQPKAELEDEQTRRHELHGEHLVHEVDGEDRIFQMSDGTEWLVLPFHRRRGINEMPELSHMSWELPIQGTCEVVGDELAQELECPIQGSEDSVGVGRTTELESRVRARDGNVVSGAAQEFKSPVEVAERSIRGGKAQGTAASVADPVTDSSNVNPSRSHFMLRQQQMQDIGDSLATDQEDEDRA